MDYQSVNQDDHKTKCNHDLIWAAGLFDAEGCFSITKNRNTYYCRAIMSLTDKNGIEDFQSIMGIGKIYGGSRLTEKQKNYWQWNAYSSEAAKAAKLLLPYLRIKREQAERLIEFDSLWVRRTRELMNIDQVTTMNIIIQEMSQLNRRGK